jgi:hypothetical protein
MYHIYRIELGIMSENEDDLPPTDVDIEEKIIVVTPSLSAGKEIKKEKGKKEAQAGSRKFVRLQKKIAGKIDQKTQAISRQTSNKNYNRVMRPSKESPLDTALRLSGSLVATGASASASASATVVHGAAAKSEKGKVAAKSRIKIAGMVDGLTPMELARKNKTGIDAFF